MTLKEIEKYVDTLGLYKHRDISYMEDMSSICWYIHPTNRYQTLVIQSDDKYTYICTEIYQSDLCATDLIFCNTIELLNKNIVKKDLVKYMTTLLKCYKNKLNIIRLKQLKKDFL